jgi:hypothetical protein
LREFPDKSLRVVEPDPEYEDVLLISQLRIKLVELKVAALVLAIRSGEVKKGPDKT